MSTATARQDIHRPSAPEFDPANYVCLGVFDTDPRGAGEIDFNITVQRAIRNGYRFDGPYTRAHRCGHCGSPLRYIAVMLHQPTGTVIYVGEDCLDNRFSLDASEFAALRAAAAAQAAATREVNRLNDTAAMVVDYLGGLDERLAELTYRGNGGTVDGNEFLTDIARKLFQYGSLSDRQVVAVANAVSRDAAYQGRGDARAKEAAVRAATAAPTPIGRVEVTGLVEHTWIKAGDYGDQAKMRIRHADGYIVIVSVPAALLALVDYDEEALRGRTVTLTATLKRISNEDPTVAYGSRPVKPTLA